MKALFFVKLLFLTCGIIKSEELPIFKLDSLTLHFDKQAKGFYDYQIQEKEKSYTKDIRLVQKDIREVHLVGKVFSNTTCIQIFPAKHERPKTPYEAIANYYFVVRTKNAKSITSLFDSSTIPYVDSMMKIKDHSNKLIEFISSIEKFEVTSIFGIPDLVIIFGKNYRKQTTSFSNMFVTNERGIYKIKSGEIDVGFLQALTASMALNDTSIIRLR